MRLFTFLASIMIAVATFADPTVSLLRVQQRYPWNGHVDIDYAITGMTVPEDYLLQFKISWTDGDNEHVVVATNFLEHATVDLPLENGNHRVTWDTKADGHTFSARNVRAELSLLYAPLTLQTARFMIVDISAGANAETYPIRLAGPVDPTSFNKDKYKTSRLVLRRNDAGSFWMGSGDQYAGPSLKLHYVKLTKDFYLGLFETTRRQYGNIMGAPEGANNYPDAETCPQKVYYGKTQASDGLLATLSRKAKYKGESIPSFVYPSESQWEYACRAGSTSAFFDDSDGYTVSEVAKYAWLKNCGAVGRSHGVGQKLPNPWGYYDMIGNEWEGCSDWYGMHPDGTEESPAIDPTGPATGTQRVAKGASFVYDAGYWSASYIRYQIEEQYNSATIRLSLTLP